MSDPDRRWPPPGQASTSTPRYRLTIINSRSSRDWRFDPDPPDMDHVSSETPFSPISIDDEIDIPESDGTFRIHFVKRIVRRFGDGVSAPKEEVFLWMGCRESIE